MKISKINVKRFTAGLMLTFFSVSSFAQEANDYGIILWMKNIQGTAMYAIQFAMLMAFAVGIYFMYAGVMSGKANLEGDKQNNSIGKILGNIIAGVILMGGVGTIEAFTGTLFGSEAVVSGAQKDAVDKTKGL
jgi:hypothetical protein